MNKFLERARELHDQMICDRRHLHRAPEVGMDLPDTVAFVKKRLAELG